MHAGTRIAAAVISSLLVLPPLSHLVAGDAPTTATAAAAPAPGEWPQWRGPARDGHSADKGLLQDWPEGGPALLWKATGIGTGYSAITVSKGRIFTMGDREEWSRVVALDGNGKVLWSTPVGKPGAPGYGGYSGPRASVTVDGDLAYAVDQWGELVCVEAATGKVVWRKGYVRELKAPRPEWGYTESPLVDGAHLIVTPGGRNGAMMALDKKTGALVWRSKDFTDEAQYSSVVPADFGGVHQFVQLTMESLVGIGAADGAVVWKAKRNGSTAVIPDPVILEGGVYVTSGYGTGCTFFRVSSEGGKLSATQVYANKVMVNHHGGVVRVGDHVYGYSDGKGWTCQDLKTGEAVWKEKEKLGKGSIAFADGRLYLREEEGAGTVAIVEASPSGWKEHGRFDQPDRTDKNSWSHPVIAGGRLYIRDQDLLLCYDVKAK